MVQWSDPKVEQIAEMLKRKFQPSRLFLYGSRASGTARPDSDYDFVMVIPQFAGGRFEVMREIASDLRKALNVEVQVWVYSQDEFDQKKDDFNSIPETAVNTGKEIELV